MKPPTLHLEIDAVWHRGKWRVVDPNGELCQQLPVAMLRSLKPYRKEGPTKWEKCVRSMKSSIDAAKGDANRHPRDPWKRRIASMVVTINGRRTPRKPKTRNTHCPYWSSRFAWMKQNLSSRARHANQLRDEWTKWARNRASAMQKRATKRAGDGE